MSVSQIFNYNIYAYSVDKSISIGPSQILKVMNHAVCVYVTLVIYEEL